MTATHTYVCKHNCKQVRMNAGFYRHDPLNAGGDYRTLHRLVAYWGWGRSYITLLSATCLPALIACERTQGFITFITTGLHCVIPEVYSRFEHYSQSRLHGLSSSNPQPTLTFPRPLSPCVHIQVASGGLITSPLLQVDLPPPGSLDLGHAPTGDHQWSRKWRDLMQAWCPIHKRAFSSRYPHSLTTWVCISVLKKFGEKKGCFYSLEFAELRIRGGFPK